MALTTQLDLVLSMAETGTADFGTPTSRVLYSKSIALTSGTGTGAADMRWSDQRTLGGAAAEDIDLAGALTGALGNTLTFARIKGILIYSVSGSFSISRPAANGFALFAAASDALAAVSAGGAFLWFAPSAAGVAVTAGSADLITITAGAGGCTYDIHIIGASA